MNKLDEDKSLDEEDVSTKKICVNEGYEWVNEMSVNKREEENEYEWKRWVWAHLYRKWEKVIVNNHLKIWIFKLNAQIHNI